MQAGVAIKGARVQGGRALRLRILAIDTALGLCAACVQQDDAETPLSAESLVMERGHAEALLPLIERVMARVDGGFKSLDRVAVTIGPGSFTGIRVGIAAARAIGLAAKIPVVGVTSLTAFAAPLVARGQQRLVGAAIDARHGHVFFQAVAPGGRSVVNARHISIRDAARALGAGPAVLAGSGAGLVAAEARALGVDVSTEGVNMAPEIAWVARLGLTADPATALPKPFYLRPADAKPQTAAQIPRQPVPQ
ncbi:putative Inactive homolog of metal-dependent proteases, molecular chaperone [Chelatococcus asaccharovorans]|nr:putative Inactive homolog of metal-dependent proteases, molecular chaperone [Chelatococcus asaccharovorans]CAH1684467.1 putative Inactive homolog of metal-dependent proteases, molecular chaperone [Chelatococcus asaccharovorans]